MAARVPNPLVQMNDVIDALGQGHIGEIYVIHGPCHLLADQSVKAIETAALGGGPSGFNVHHFDGANQNDLDAALDACNTLPMMATRRVIHLSHGHKIDKTRLKRLKAYLESPSPSATLLIKSAQMLRGDSALVKACKKSGHNLAFRTLYDREIPDFIKAEARRLGKRMDGRGIRYLQEMVGSDLGELRTQMEKISLFVGEKERIEIGDLEGVVSDIHLDTIFAFNDAVGAGRVDQALLNLSRMFDAAQSSIGLLSMLHRHFRNLVATHELLIEKRMELDEVAAETGIYGNRVYMWKKNFLPQVRGWQRQNLHRALALIQGTHIKLRQSAVPGQTHLEHLILQIAALRRQRVS